MFWNWCWKTWKLKWLHASNFALLAAAVILGLVALLPFLLLLLPQSLNQRNSQRWWMSSSPLSFVNLLVHTKFWQCGWQLIWSYISFENLNQGERGGLSPGNFSNVGSANRKARILCQDSLWLVKIFSNLLAKKIWQGWWITWVTDCALLDFFFSQKMNIKFEWIPPYNSPTCITSASLQLLWSLVALSFIVCQSLR